MIGVGTDAIRGPVDEELPKVELHRHHGENEEEDGDDGAEGNEGLVDALDLQVVFFDERANRLAATRGAVEPGQFAGQVLTGGPPIGSSSAHGIAEHFSVRSRDAPEAATGDVVRGFAVDRRDRLQGANTEVGILRHRRPVRRDRVQQRVGVHPGALLCVRNTLLAVRCLVLVEHSGLLCQPLDERWRGQQLLTRVNAPGGFECGEKRKDALLGFVRVDEGAQIVQDRSQAGQLRFDGVHGLR